MGWGVGSTTTDLWTAVSKSGQKPWARALPNEGKRAWGLLPGGVNAGPRRWVEQAATVKKHSSKLDEREGESRKMLHRQVWRNAAGSVSCYSSRWLIRRVTKLVTEKKKKRDVKAQSKERLHAFQNYFNLLLLCVWEILDLTHNSSYQPRFDPCRVPFTMGR